MTHNGPGKLIVFEGIDGTGKSTQIQLLAEALRKRGYTVVTSREPTDGPHGQTLRRSMVEGRLSKKDELQLFEEDRRHHVETLIQPALTQGKIVILDRYYFSTMAYQGALGFDPTEIRQRNESFAPVPDAVLILEVPIDTAIQRIGTRDGSVNTFEHRENLEACARLFQNLRDDFIHHIDATQKPKDLHLSVLSTLSSYLPPINPPERKNSLERFLQGLFLVAKPGSIISRYLLGFGLVWRQIQKVRAQTRSVKLPISGFRQDLIAYGQDGELYRHLHFHIGCSLMGLPGRILSWAMHRVDLKQQSTGRLESITEVRNNLAARDCGQILLHYLKGQISQSEAQAKMRNLLGEKKSRDDL